MTDTPATTTAGDPFVWKFSPGEAEMLRQLFFNGPTWDGFVVSKQARDSLVKKGLAFHRHGFASLTEAGIDSPFVQNLYPEKERGDVR